MCNIKTDIKKQVKFFPADWQDITAVPAGYLSFDFGTLKAFGYQAITSLRGSDNSDLTGLETSKIRNPQF